ncbi:MAG TPA: ABC transporter ATP-binding protein, partial [Pseudohongiella sp.]|nr:ABC transporter ATP-binding protein [Pseudohongiella sp.]
MSYKAVSARPDVSHNVILYIENLSVSFDGFKALNNLSLYVNDGELRCLIGANGAGKTTLMDVITGKTRCDSGQVWFGQTIDLLKHDEAAIARLGIGRKFQKPTVFEALTVYENQELSLASHKGVWSTLMANVSAAQKDQMDQVLETIGLVSERHRKAGVLSHGQKQWLEIGM